MALYKVDEYYADYQALFDGNDILNFDVYGQGNDKVGSVKNALVDEDGNFRYFIVDTGFWVFGKKVLLPVGMTRIDFDDKRVYAEGLTKKQVEDLPEFSEDLALDRDYEERVRGVYRPSIATPTSSAVYDTTTYNYTQEPYFYEMNEPNLRMYEERLREGRNRTRADIL